MRPTACFIIFFVCGLTAAENWPQWRGPNRDGVAPAFRGPAAWPEKLQAKWKIEVGEGHSSPIIGDGRIFQFARLNNQETMQAIDPASGKVLWKQSYDAAFTRNIAAFFHGKGPKSTPVYADGRVYGFGISGSLTCFQASDGKIVWRKDFSKQYESTWPEFGVAMSPILWEGLLIAHTGGNNNGSLTAFDAVTGAEKWMWKGDGPGYGSPVIGVFDQVPQLITESQKNLVAVNPKNGDLLWQIALKTPYEQNSVTPVIADGAVIYSGLDNGIKAVQPLRKGGVWSIEQLWESKSASFNMSTPVVIKGRLIGFSHKNKGQFVVIDPKTGATLFTSDGRQGDNSAIVAGAGVVLLLKNDSELLVLREDASKFESIRRYKVAESETWAHPLLLDSGIVIKDASTLAFWTW